MIERIVHKCHSFDEADRWDRQQAREMTPDERFAVYQALKEQAYPNAEDVRDCLRDPSIQLAFRKIIRNSSGSYTVMESGTSS